MTYRKFKAFNDPALAAFMPGNGKNTILRLAANTLGIPLQEEGQPMQQQEPFGGMSEWAGNLNPGSKIASIKPPQTKPQQYAQYGGWGYYNQHLPGVYNSYDEMNRSEDKLTPEQYMVYRGVSNLPPEPQRPFEADFPNRDYKADPKTGRMMTDIDGRPINPNAVIVGRSYENQEDSALSDQDGSEIIKGLTGYHVINGVPDWSKGNIAGYIPEIHDDKYGGIFVDFKTIKEDERIANPYAVVPEVGSRLAKHEMGHLFDHVIGTMNDSVDKLPDDVMEEFSKIYNESRNPRLGFKRLSSPRAKAEDNELWHGWNPGDDGYIDDQVRGELFAEGLRAYLTDPNAMKTRFPKVARYLRDYVNTNPTLNQYIHLSNNNENMQADPDFSLAKQNRNI